MVLIVLAGGLFLQGCASPAERTRTGPPAAVSPLASSAREFAAAGLGSEIAMRAMSLLGTPYHYGGEAPGGFDCSGLVRFVHRQLGIDVPRTTLEQYSAADPVGLEQLAPGDLLFFKTRGTRVSHVAIYTGEGRFIHAPQTGRTVELRTLDDAYYRPRLAGAGRLF
ncbi:C40 family peptidase [Steroidobacter denitrificans]|nr:C40 family peptidase [Steroidobacter denitrificans]